VAAPGSLRKRCAPVLLTLIACSSETRVRLLEPASSAGGAGSPAVSQAGSSGDASLPEAGVKTDAGVTAPHLIHRYSFDGEGTRVVDSIRHADGELMNGAALDGAGHVSLDGKTQYVNLPNGLISSLTDATLVTWLAWNGGPCWQRVFDFGSTDAGEDLVGNATTSVFATPLRCPENGPATAIETTSVVGSVDANVMFPQLQNSPITVVLDVTAGELRLYSNHLFIGSGAVEPLSSISDVNDWLGQSQWTQDVHLRGTYDEFRIYDTALTPDEVAAVENAGPDFVGP